MQCNLICKFNWLNENHDKEILFINNRFYWHNCLKDNARGSSYLPVISNWFFFKFEDKKWKGEKDPKEHISVFQIMGWPFTILPLYSKIFVLNCINLHVRQNTSAHSSCSDHVQFLCWNKLYNRNEKQFSEFIALAEWTHLYKGGRSSLEPRLNYHPSSESKKRTSQL